MDTQKMLRKRDKKKKLKKDRKEQANESASDNEQVKHKESTERRSSVDEESQKPVIEIDQAPAKGEQGGDDKAKNDSKQSYGLTLIYRVLFVH